MMDGLELTEMEFRLLRDYIHDRFGIYFKDDKRSFIRMKLYPRVLASGLITFGEYLHWLKYGSDSAAEQSRAISALTNNETYFFREMPQLEAFRDHLLPRIREQKVSGNSRDLRVLSAGCSTGEEVYSLAILIFESGGFFWDWKVKVTGMDVDDQALARARSGIFPERSFRMSEGDYVEKYFSPNHAGLHIRPTIRQFTDFHGGNIADPKSWPADGPHDVIFCRNVLIYFSEPKVRQAIEAFHEALAPGGFLLLGHSETLTGISHSFRAIRLPQSIVYQKKCEGDD